MSKYVAKKAELDVMKECQSPHCSRFTSEGYYIRYRNTNVDSILFVCTDCFNRYYRTSCSIGTFDENEYFSLPDKRYCNGNPLLRKFKNWLRKGLYYSRLSVIVLSVILISAFALKEQPRFRSEYVNPHINFEINSIHIKDPSPKFQSISGQLKKVVNHIGGPQDD